MSPVVRDWGPREPYCTEALGMGACRAHLWRGRGGRQVLPMSVVAGGLTIRSVMEDASLFTLLTSA
jgi:hypothetical protein